MARKPLRPLIRSGGFYPSRKWTPLVYAGGYTTANGGGEPTPPPIEKTVIGNPIHILDALAKPAQALSVKLEPIQDLNGYDNPWPSGGGKNKFDISTISSGTTSGIPYTVTNGTISYNGTASYGGCIVFGTFTLPQTGTYHFHMDTTGDGGRFLEGWTNKGADVTIVCEDTSTVYRIVAVSATAGESYTGTLSNIQVETGSSYTGYSPYSNICPISGHTDADVTRTGVNVWDEEWEVGGISNTTGNNTTGSQIRSKNFIPIKPNTTYFGLALGQSSRLNFQTRLYDADKNYIGTGSLWYYNKSYTTPNNAYYMRFCMQNNYGTTYNNDISINYPSTDHDYHAYSGTTYSIAFPTEAGTVYGGTLDVTTGKLTVDRAIVDLGTLTWTSASGNRKQCVELTNSIAKPTSTVEKGNLIAERYANVNASDLFSYSSLIGISVNIGGYLIARTNGEEVSGKLVYELATPITIQLTPTQVELLQGENNLWSDGTMTLVYLADGNASDIEALNILLGGRYVNNHGEDEPTDREALNIILGGNER